MTKRFEERWRDTAGEPFEFEGNLVHPLYRREIEPDTLIDVEFIGSRPNPVQGLRMEAKGAKLAWDEHGLEGSSVRLWADKQDRATIRYVNPRKTTDLVIWNVWLDHDVVQAWWAWSGMLLEESADSVVLRCSGSYDGPDFTDLIAQINFRHI